MKYQKLFKTLIRSRFHGMYWCGHKTATLTSNQHTVWWTDYAPYLGGSQQFLGQTYVHPVKQSAHSTIIKCTPCIIQNMTYMEIVLILLQICRTLNHFAKLLLIDIEKKF